MNLKKTLLAITGIVLILIITVFFLVIFPFMGTEKVQPGSMFAGGTIINVVDGISQVFILEGGKGGVGLVDAGNSADGKPIIDVLASEGFKPSDVKAVFLTHGHHDHIAAATRFPNAKIYALKEEVEIAEGIKNNPSPLGRIISPKPTGLKVTNILKDGEKVNLGSMTVEVFSIPGHTEGSAAYLISGVLFLGDAALSTTEGKVKHAIWVFSSDVDQQSRSIKALVEKLIPRKNEIKTITFSHSGYLAGLQPLIDFAAKVPAK